MPSLPNVIELTQQLVRIPSVNPMGQAPDDENCYESRLTDFLERYLRTRGFPVYRDTVTPAAGETPARENILTYSSGQNGTEADILLLEVHQDTVPVAGMTIDPWCAELSEGRIYGRGACDVKGGMACLIAAFLQAAQRHGHQRPHLVLACTVNEEHGFSGATRLKQLWSSGECDFLPRAPDAILVAEPTELDIIVAHKGVVRWRCQTVGRAAHSSAPHRGRNAIYDMARIVTQLQQYASELVGAAAAHPLVGPPTLSVGTIHGGVSVNTVPDRCEIHIDRRVGPSESPWSARQQVIDYLAAALPDEIHLQHGPPDIISPGLEHDRNRELAQRLVDVARKHGVPAARRGAEYGTDAAILATGGPPAVVFGPGSIEQAHTADEWVAVSQLQTAVTIVTDFIAAWHQNTSNMK